jgi:polar amino acid transport system substrate-binding protein
MNRRSLVRAILFAASLSVVACADVPPPSAARAIAPTGVLRGTFLASNPAQVRKGPNGELEGIVPDLIREMARRLGVPYDIQPAANAADIVRRIGAHESDIGFFAYDAKRGTEVDFSQTYALMYNAFTTRADSTITRTADVDRTGVKVAAVSGQTQLTVLQETLHNASLRPLDRKPTQSELETLLTSGGVDVYGANRQDAEQIAAASKGRLKTLPDNFSFVEQAIVTPHGETAKIAAVNQLLDAMRRDGFMARSLANMHIVGLEVATPKAR